MKSTPLPIVVLGIMLSLSCGGEPEPANSRQSTNAAKSETAADTRQVAPSVTSSHGGAAAAANVAAGTEKPPVETPELDAQVDKALAKAKSASASAADKLAAAKAYLERGNFFYNAQDKRLYRYALGDFRRALKFDPENKEAKEKIGTIESIYESLGRPIPANGLEP